MTAKSTGAHYTAAQLAQGASAPAVLDLDAPACDWEYSGLRIVNLAAGESYSCPTGEYEVLIVPLVGGATVSATCGEDGAAAAEEAAFECELTGRDSVFVGPTDRAYVPAQGNLTLTATRDARIALTMAKAEGKLPCAYYAAEGVPVEYRGAGNASRRVLDLGTPAVVEAESLIVCEVITPGGNWSSYPPHKHDEVTESESQLEEIYYYEVGNAPDGQPGMAYQRVYSTRDETPIDVLAEVRQGDVVLIPHGWHGPSMATPGYDLYYLNVMAGPERRWHICDDPNHGWVRGEWAHQPRDPRVLLPGYPGSD